MAVSRLLPSGGANDFNLNVVSAYTSVTLDKEYAPGSYSILSGANDITLDIYAYNINGSLAGYTNTKAFSATQGFSKLVILGGTAGDVLGFSYKTTFATVSDSDEVTAGPFIVSTSTTSFPATTTTANITGGNFASNITGTFTSASTSTVYTATISYTNPTLITVGRPAVLPAAFSPYVLTLSNPGVADPIGSNVNKINISAGTGPVWVTGTLATFTSGSAYDGPNLLATDDSGVTYSIVTGTLPTGLSFNTSTGVISGTATAGQNSVTFRASDNGGNTADRIIKFNARPIWNTAAGSLAGATTGLAYSVQLSASDDAAITYTLTSGTLPSGLTLSSNGLISGTPSSGNSNLPFAVTVTDIDNITAVRLFNIATAISVEFQASTTWTAPTGVTSLTSLVVCAGGGAGGGNWDSGATVGSGGGGGGGVATGTNISVTPGTAYSIVVGGGGGGVSGSYVVGNNGSNSTAFGLTGNGGGGGAPNTVAANSGGCGGGGARSSGGSGSQGGSGGGNSGNQYTGSGGGGMGGSGATGNSGSNGGAGGPSATYFSTYVLSGGGGGGGANGIGGTAGGNGTNGAGGTSGTANAPANRGGGSGGPVGAASGNGGSGIVIFRYNG